MTPRRACAAMFVVCAVVAAAGCSGGSGKSASASPPTRAPATATSSPATPSTARVATTAAPVLTSPFATEGLRFAYPRAWAPTEYEYVTSFTNLIVYLSNVKLHDPCTTTHLPGEVSTTCSDPVNQLSPGGVLVAWRDWGLPRPGPAIPHPNLTVDRKPARLTVARPGTCARVGAQETITVDIARSESDNYYEMVACLRDPGITRNEALVRRMITGTRISD